MTKALLVVDDSQTIRRAVDLVFRGTEFSVVSAKNAAQAMDRLTDPATMPTIILIDAVLPDHDGYDLCKRLKGQDATKEIPLLIMVNSTGPNEARVNEAEIDGYIVKPFSAQELLVPVNILTDTAMESNVPTSYEEKLASRAIEEKAAQEAAVRRSAPPPARATNEAGKKIAAGIPIITGSPLHGGVPPRTTGVSRSDAIVPDEARSGRPSLGRKSQPAPANIAVKSAGTQPGVIMPMTAPGGPPQSTGRQGAPGDGTSGSGPGAKSATAKAPPPRRTTSSIDRPIPTAPEHWVGSAIPPPLGSARDFSRDSATIPPKQVLGAGPRGILGAPLPGLPPLFPPAPAPVIKPLVPLDEGDDTLNTRAPVFSGPPVSARANAPEDEDATLAQPGEVGVPPPLAGPPTDDLLAKTGGPDSAPPAPERAAEDAPVARSRIPSDPDVTMAKVDRDARKRVREQLFALDAGEKPVGASPPTPEEKASDLVDETDPGTSTVGKKPSARTTTADPADDAAIASPAVDDQEKDGYVDLSEPAVQPAKVLMQTAVSAPAPQRRYALIVTVVLLVGVGLAILAAVRLL